MSHTQPSPTAGVAPHHAAHMAAHAQVNGHIQAIPAQPPKGAPLTTAQKITALNEQVWLQIGKDTSIAIGICDRLLISFSRSFRKLDRAHGRPGWFYECIRAGLASQPVVCPGNECYLLYSAHQGAIPQGHRVPPKYPQDGAHER